MVEYHPISVKDQSRLHQFGEKVLPGIFLGYALVESGKEILWLQTLRSSENWTRQKSMLKGSMRKNLITPKSGDNFTFPIADGTATLFGKDYGVRESTRRTCKK